MHKKVKTELNHKRSDIKLRLEMCIKIVYHKLKNEYGNSDVNISSLVNNYLETSKQYCTSPFNTNQLASFNDQIFRMYNTEKLSDTFKVMINFGDPNIIKLVQNSYHQLDLKCNKYETVDFDKDRDNNLVNTLIRMITSTTLGSNNLPVSEFAKKMNHHKLKEFKYNVFEKIVSSLNDPKHSTTEFIDAFMHDPIYDVFLSANEKNKIKLLNRSYDDPNKDLIVQYAKTLDDLFRDKEKEVEKKPVPIVNVSPTPSVSRNTVMKPSSSRRSNPKKRKPYVPKKSLWDKIKLPLLLPLGALAGFGLMYGLDTLQQPQEIDYKEECVNLYNQSKFEEALPMCNQAIVLEPENDVFHGVRGLIYSKNKAFDLALNDFKTAWELNSEEDYYLELICTAYHSKGDYDNAIKVCSEVIEKNPGLGMVHVMLDSAYEKKASHESEKYEEKSEERYEESPAEEAAMEEIND